MIPGLTPRANELSRTFRVRSGTETGTAFVIDVDQRQYLVSALHVVERTVEMASIDIFNGGEWRSSPVTVVGYDEDNDIAVFALPAVLATHPIRIDADGATFGNGAFFLGYPLGLVGAVDNGFSIAVPRHGTICGFIQGPPRRLYLSCSSLPGFSGAPVYFARDNIPVLTAVLLEEFAYGNPVKNTAGEEIGTVMLPSCIVSCCFISEALNLIASNPVGRGLS
jgi:S1-C subfamily serine protease